MNQPTELLAERQATLRPYQREAVDAVERHLAGQESNPCIVIPTGGGKSHVIGAKCRNAVARGQRVIVLAHVKELLEQNYGKIVGADPHLDVGVYSAGLGRRDTGTDVLIAGIQSVCDKADRIGPRDLIIIDEAHLIPPDGEGRYRTFISACQQINPTSRVIGLTATPYRTSSGPICTADGILNEVVYEVAIRQLIDEGYLSPLKSKAGRSTPDFGKLHLRGGEFVEGEAAELMNDEELVERACGEIVDYTEPRKACLIFAAGIEHGRHVAEVIGGEFICADTPAPEREKIVAAFKAGHIKYLSNVNVLSVGFDVPHIDSIALLRPTMSPGLYYQMCGRGFRVADGKDDCLVLDFAGNVQRHGPVDAIDPERTPRKSGDAPVKTCPGCQSIVALSTRTCPDCGFAFEFEHKPQHSATAGDCDVLTRGANETAERLLNSASRAGVRIVRDGDDLRAWPRKRVSDDLLRRLKQNRDAVRDVVASTNVLGVSFHLHHGDYGDALKVGYVDERGQWVNEFLTPGTNKADLWWRDSGGLQPVPVTASEALERKRELSRPAAITTRPKGRFRKVVGWTI